MSFRNYFIYCVCASPLSTSAHPKLANSSSTVNCIAAEKPEKITRNRRANERERRNQREIIYKIDMFHHVPWILMCVCGCDRSGQLVSSRMRITHIISSTDCDSSLCCWRYFRNYLFFSLLRCLPFFSASILPSTENCQFVFLINLLLVCFCVEINLICKEEKRKNRHNFSLFSHPLLGVSNS